MSARTFTWHEGMAPLGDAVVAIGVFDGVHLGHQSLLASAVADAIERGVDAVAVTFDRDPDQVVSPETAAPQLLTLDDKLGFMSESGVDSILVIPFTRELAEMTPADFLELVLVRGVRPIAVHVGGDFRFGRRAEGDVATLQREGEVHGYEVRAHELVSAGGRPVTSSRIRALVATGDVREASTLLGRPSRVAGHVHRGRGEGAALGFPTANVVPVEFAAIPADGVYAGRAVLTDGERWPAAISVGRPPTFPHAEDFLEAHLVGFDGDLYEASVVLEFCERLRAHEAYPSLEALTKAIADDVEEVLRIVPDEWAPIVGPIEFFGSLAAGAKAFMLTATLDVAGIPFRWDPYPPESRPAGLPAGGTYQQPFTLLVPGDCIDTARSVIAATLVATEPPVVDEAEPEPAAYIEDPEVLEAAERAVYELGRRPARVPSEPIDGWMTVSRDIAYDKKRLGAIEYALSAAGIVAEWLPFPPSEAPLLRLFGLHETLFTLRVPSDDLEAAREIVQGAGELEAGV